jgi:predicted transposase YdaD
LPTGDIVHSFAFQNIKLWEIPSEVLMQQKLSGLLPLLPLTREGKKREMVEQMISGLQLADKQDLLPLGYAFSALVFEQEIDQQWLKERFLSMEDILEESWAYREMVQKGLAKGLEQGLQKGLAKGLEQGLKQELQTLRTTLIRFVETHFPEQVPLAKQQVELTTTSAQLQQMLDELFVARTDNEVMKILLDLPK